ncbi:MAG: ABC transporter permease [Armatimonadota bacterium]|nr:ABC transporter permease [Armatimonadota bacterium]MDR7467320.1 ABC transporter permease [Armatimonadota bacterium]MDR7494091.1 ABC transporter permease [Armatimonadota bacterium]MDR7498942.1 ABC transporter permease [Armatimonadota bacterium]MDR7504347.1 ABC transporter permease [Armatimonadota bacterium]
MVGYLGRRLVDLLAAVLGVSTIAFLALRLSGDPVALLITEYATEAEIARVRALLGLDQPLWVQYGRFLSDVLRGEFGESLRFIKPAATVVWETLPATMTLAVAAVAIATVVAVPLGILAAVRRGTVLDGAATVLATLGQSMPYFWLGILLILVFAVHLRVLPPFGSGTWRHLVLPAVTLSMTPLARTMRLVRSGMVEVLGQDYIRTAWAKGLGWRRVLFRHALHNAAIPVVTILGLDFGTLLGGAVVTETIFAWPGVGRLIVQAIQSRDYPVVQAAVFYLALVFVLINLLVDVVYAHLDPRIKYQ